MTEPLTGWRVAAVCGWAVAAVLLVLLFVQWGRLDALRAQVDRACAGRVAALDLTEWVQVCQVTMPQDLGR